MWLAWAELLKISDELVIYHGSVAELKHYAKTKAFSLCSTSEVDFSGLTCFSPN